MAVKYELERLPKYLQDLFANESQPIEVLDVPAIKELDSSAAQYRHLLLRRHSLTDQIANHGLHPPLILMRAVTYDNLGYPDLAAADAFVAYILGETVRSDEWISDLQPVELSGEPWPSASDERENLRLLCQALATLCQALVRLGASEDAEEKFNELAERYQEYIGAEGKAENSIEQAKKYLNELDARRIYDQGVTFDFLTSPKHKFGWTRREIYPWNEYEPDRNSPESLSQINTLLHQTTQVLEAKVTILPALNEDGTSSEGGVWHQLGLFARTDLPPGTEILREKSLLTAIRPLDDALCDACGADLESIPRDAMRQCPGEDCDTTFCSEDCATRAANEYHNPNILATDADEEDDNADTEIDIDPDYPPPHAPFCGNTALHEIGRTSSTTTPEWDLYFLLLTRTVACSTTQSTHPLLLPSTKFLWGDFSPVPSPTSFPPTTTTSPPQHNTLPWSLHHNLTLPLQYFETLMHSLPTFHPYSRPWLEEFDWWIQTTLVAKFRGVANAQQSTFDGKPEIAAVHPMWCLANHSCEPNVAWTPSGERVFTVVEQGKGVGIGKGEEVWSHYTDVRLGVRERRERLVEVLGGVCMCRRCVREAGE